MKYRMIQAVVSVAAKLIRAGFSEAEFEIFVNEDTDEISISQRHITELDILNRGSAILDTGLGILISEWPTGLHVDIVPENGLQFVTFATYPAGHTAGDESVDAYNAAIIEAVSNLKRHQEAMNMAASFFANIPATSLEVIR